MATVLALHLKKHILRYHSKEEDYCKTECNSGRNQRVNLMSKQQFSKLSRLLNQLFCQSYGFAMFEAGRIAI